MSTMVSPPLPCGHPVLPEEVAGDEVVAIVTIYNAQAQNANQETAHIKTQVGADQTHQGAQRGVVGINIFLRRVNDQPYFSMGREMIRDSDTKARRGELDVYLPGKAIGIRQCTLIPDWERNCWRLESLSDFIAVVNGAPIQKYTKRTKQSKKPLPKAIFLKQFEVNTVTVDGLEIDIWLLKPVRDVYEAGQFVPEPLEHEAQDVTNRTEEWAREQYNMTREQVSTMTFRVVQRFTGEKATAKVFLTGDHREQVRDEEFLKFNKQEVDASVVRYKQSTEIDNIPSIITGTYENFASYSALRDEIHQFHPGSRFSIASKLIRRLSSALSWMHYNKIIHGQVSSDSVLLRLVNRKVEHVLLVDYTDIDLYVPGEPVPMTDMLDDGKYAMKLVEDCCDIWTFRNGPTPQAMNEDLMQKRTLDAMDKYQTCLRVTIDLFDRQGKSRESVKGKKLLRLLDKLYNGWSTARAHQAENLTARHITDVCPTAIDELIEEWDKANPPQNSIYKQYMVLSLGHSYLDNLANQLHVKQWNTTPQEVCVKIKEFGGDLEEPWQTFEVRRSTPIEHTDTGYNAQHVINWLAACCEFYPEWCQALEVQYENHIHLIADDIVQLDLLNLYNALKVHGPLPPSMVTMFEALTTTVNLQQQMEEVYQVWYHIPSRLFNVTQLHRLATPEVLAATLKSGSLRCDHFVEVRGDPKVEGCYVPLSLLTDFVDQLGLQLPQAPDLTVMMPTFDPSDFSQVPQSRIVLARPGLLGFGSMLRTNDQANFLYSRTAPTFILPSTFILTYFGDMKVLPKLPNGVRSYHRPEHWSKYQTADEFELSTDLNKRQIINANRPIAGKSGAFIAPSSILSGEMEIDKPVLAQVLRTRERIRSEAHSLAKRNTNGVPGFGSSSRLSKRARKGTDIVPLSLSKKALPEITTSFVQRMEDCMQNPPSSDQALPQSDEAAFMDTSFAKRNSALLNELPPNPFDQSPTVPDDTEGLEDDWKAIEALLLLLPDDEEDEPEIEGITGFIIHGSSGTTEGESEPVTMGLCIKTSPQGSPRPGQGSPPPGSSPQDPSPQATPIQGIPPRVVLPLPDQGVFGTKSTISPARMSMLLEQPPSQSSEDSPPVAESAAVSFMQAYGLPTDSVSRNSNLPSIHLASASHRASRTVLPTILESPSSGSTIPNTEPNSPVGSPAPMVEPTMSQIPGMLPMQPNFLGAGSEDPMPPTQSQGSGSTIPDTQPFGDPEPTAPAEEDDSMPPTQPQVFGSTYPDTQPFGHPEPASSLPPTQPQFLGSTYPPTQPYIHHSTPAASIVLVPSSPPQAHPHSQPAPSPSPASLPPQTQSSDPIVLETPPGSPTPDPSQAPWNPAFNTHETAEYPATQPPMQGDGLTSSTESQVSSTCGSPSEEMKAMLARAEVGLVGRGDGQDGDGDAEEDLEDENEEDMDEDDRMWGPYRWGREETW
jgi:hypothetical protein